MATYQELQELKDSLSSAAKAMRKVSQTSKRKGEVITITHPVSEEEVGLGRISQNDVKNAKQEAQAEIDALRQKVNNIDLTQPEEPK